jgi:hypothetical protein
MVTTVMTDRGENAGNRPHRPRGPGWLSQRRLRDRFRRPARSADTARLPRSPGTHRGPVEQAGTCWYAGSPFLHGGLACGVEGVETVRRHEERVTDGAHAAEPFPPRRTLVERSLPVIGSRVLVGRGRLGVRGLRSVRAGVSSPRWWCGCWPRLCTGRKGVCQIFCLRQFHSRLFSTASRRDSPGATQ